MTAVSRVVGEEGRGEARLGSKPEIKTTINKTKRLNKKIVLRFVTWYMFPHWHLDSNGHSSPLPFAVRIMTKTKMTIADSHWHIPMTAGIPGIIFLSLPRE